MKKKNYPTCTREYWKNLEQVPNMKDFLDPITTSQDKCLKEQHQLFVKFQIERGLSKYAKLHNDSIKNPTYVNRIRLQISLVSLGFWGLFCEVACTDALGKDLWHVFEGEERLLIANLTNCINKGKLLLQGYSLICFGFMFQ